MFTLYRWEERGIRWNCNSRRWETRWKIYRNRTRKLSRSALPPSTDLVTIEDDSGDKVIRLHTPYVKQPGSTDQHHSGRKQSLFWSEFVTEKLGNKIVQNSCQHCGARNSPQACRMEALKKCKNFKSKSEEESKKRKPQDEDGCPESLGPVVAVKKKRM